MQFFFRDGFQKLFIPLSRDKLWDTVQDLFHLLSVLAVRLFEQFLVTLLPLCLGRINL
uniref:Uncharacterized protein n=1 Tax=Picea glauca TaxID=3330 RepID=A0A101LWU4_PICGL|nr:hypothetical protein ABT39_MTgene6282 [Picea glauca]QHR87521.1 hypothetical protein Q903MT_gene1532 [Picea sitchensis]